MIQRSDSTTEAVAVTGPSAGKAGAVTHDYVAPRYLDALDIQLLAGRDFRASDTDDTPRVALVSASLARDFFGGEALGQRIRTGRDARAAEAEIIGVFADTTMQNPRTPDPYAVLLPTYQTSAARRQPRLLVRSPLDQKLAVPAINQALEKLGGQYVISTRSIHYQQREAFREERMMLELTGAAAGFALFLSCLGLYGLLSYLVTQRTPEIGLRAALGATRWRTIAWLARRSARVMLPGIAAGALVAWWAMRWSAHLLEGFTVTPFAGIAMACAVILAASILATALPALRAARIDPATALRHE